MFLGPHDRVGNLRHIGLQIKVEPDMAPHGQSQTTRFVRTQDSLLQWGQALHWNYCELVWKPAAQAYVVKQRILRPMS